MKYDTTRIINTSEKMEHLLNTMAGMSGSNIHDITNNLWRGWLLNSLDRLQDIEPNNWHHHQQIRNKIHQI